METERLAGWLVTLRTGGIAKDERFTAQLKVSQLETFVRDAIEYLRGDPHKLALLLELDGPSLYFVQALANEYGDVCADASPTSSSARASN